MVRDKVGENHENPTRIFHLYYIQTSNDIYIHSPPRPSKPALQTVVLSRVRATTLSKNPTVSLSSIKNTCIRCLWYLAKGDEKRSHRLPLQGSRATSILTPLSGSLCYDANRMLVRLNCVLQSSLLRNLQLLNEKFSALPILICKEAVHAVPVSSADAYHSP